MKDFDEISKGIRNWNKTAYSLKEADIILKKSIEFAVKANIPLDETPADVHAYLGLTENDLFVVLIQASKDLVERYEDDLEGVLEDMVILQSRPRQLTSLDSDNLVTAYPISEEEALERMANWADDKKRTKVMEEVQSAPQVFELPKGNFEVQGGKKLLFGLKDKSENISTPNKLEYDFMFEVITAPDVLGSSSFYDVAMSIPPFKPKGNLGLNEYLGIII